MRPASIEPVLDRYWPIDSKEPWRYRHLVEEVIGKDVNGLLADVHGDSSERRFRAASVLAMKREYRDRVMPVLVEALDDSRPEVRRVGAIHLNQFGQQGYDLASRMVEMLDDDDALVRSRAVSYLGWAAAARSLTGEARWALLERAMVDPSPEVRYGAVRAAARLDPIAARFLVVRGLADADAGVRAVSAWEVRQVGHDQAIRDALGALLADADATVLPNLLQAIGGDPEVPVAQVEALLERALDPDPKVVGMAIEALLRLERSRIDAYAWLTDEDPRKQTVATILLWDAFWIRPDERVRFLIDRLADPATPWFAFRQRSGLRTTRARHALSWNCSTTRMNRFASRQRVSYANWARWRTKPRRLSYAH